MLSPAGWSLWRSFGYPLRLSVRRDVALEAETGRSSWHRAGIVSLVCQLICPIVDDPYCDSIAAVFDPQMYSDAEI